MDLGDLGSTPSLNQIRVFMDREKLYMWFPRNSSNLSGNVGTSFFGTEACLLLLLLYG